MKRCLQDASRSSGLGLFLTRQKGASGLVVSALAPGGAAERSGKIRVGDRVVAVCGSTTVGLQPAEAVDLILSEQRERLAG